MTKYFIERSDGMWLTDPEHRMESWTRDPYKAWAFDYDRTVMTNCERVHSTSNFLNFIVKEGCLSNLGIHVTEQEFINRPDLSSELTHITYYRNPVTGKKGIEKWTVVDPSISPGSSYHLSRTSKESFMDQFMTGESWIKITPEH